jgi:hypothetical protein
VKGQVKPEEGVLIMRQIHVGMHLHAPEKAWEAIQRVHGLHAVRCPLYRTLHEAIRLRSSFELVARLSRHDQGYLCLNYV